MILRLKLGVRITCGFVPHCPYFWEESKVDRYRLKMKCATYDLRGFGEQLHTIFILTIQHSRMSEENYMQAVFTRFWVYPKGHAINTKGYR